MVIVLGVRPVDPWDWYDCGWVLCLLSNCIHLRHEVVNGMVLLRCVSERETSGRCCQTAYVRGWMEPGAADARKRYKVLETGMRRR